MDKESEQQFDDIEETHAGLRMSIEQAKELTQQSDRLIKRHRKGDDGDTDRH